ncbi:MAG: ArsR family transcriptional regulator [Mesorhizobium sp.]|nr:metalloregulator ArsR/SmtB family transcription factor [Mesorhizobium sp.]RWN52153.1 MAG: ArsR family transcriptional regulator [Mesorhizobium sp.]RWN73252.1 MAG: ArsR family transcriptional regulator [Mesorhizobium sp.]RWN75354.1 MAG: ArsR family transcriptional regulator [Mesorhizobium sp.]RWN83031.1 MAG: ArsR family transcriptional regulator [Mesorhizobium sp.]RWO10877.1 MAG: ArsR family transcriptional regulator [Mesorhizobium sp.]
MKNADVHHPIFDEIADLARTLGHAHRLVLLRHIADGELAVEQLTQLSGIALANTSQHLQQLKRAGLVQTRRDGKRVLYRLADGPIENVLGALRSLANHRREQIRELIDDTMSRPDRLENISREELVRRIRDDEIVLLDVRPQEEYAAAHLPGAINIPAGELEERLAELPREKVIVAYCRGVQCVLSADALAILRARGWASRRFEGGFPEWLASDLDVDGMNYESG